MPITVDELNRRRAAAEIDRGTCLFPGLHLPGHSADQVFVVAYDGVAWQPQTEAQILADGRPFLHTSGWDFWYEDQEGDA